MANSKPLLDVESVTEHNEEILVKENASAQHSVSVTDYLPTPKYGPWVAMALSTLMAISLVVIACYEFRLLDVGYMHPVAHAGFAAVRLIVALAAKGYITSQIMILWLYEICRPQVSKVEAKRKSTLGKVLVGIAELKDRAIHWRATAFVLLAAALLAFLQAAVTAYPAKEARQHKVSPLPSTFQRAQCLGVYQTEAEARNTGYIWQVAGGDWLSARTTIPYVGDSACPWYSVSSILGISSTAVGYAYSVAGVPVNRSAIGVPSRLGSSEGPFEPIFGTDEAARTPLRPWADNSTGFIYGASACLPVLVDNPVKCHSTGAVSSQPASNTFSFGSQVCGGSFVRNMGVPLAQVVSGYASWGVCNNTDFEVGHSTFVMGAIGDHAVAYADLMGEKAINANGVLSYSLACEVNVQPNIGFRNITYFAEQVRATGNTIFTVTGSDQACRPTDSSGAYLNQSLIVNDDAFAIGVSGVQGLIEENSGMSGYPSLLTQLHAQQQNNKQPLNFNSSKTSLEDSLGVSIGATLGVYWGATLPNFIPNGYNTSVTFGYTRLGPGGYWPIVFAFPFFGVTIVALISLQKKSELERLAGGQVHKPTESRKSWWKFWRLGR